MSVAEPRRKPVQTMETQPQPRAPGSGRWRSLPPGPQGFLIWATVIFLCFAVPLYRLAVFAWVVNDLYSYVLLMPFISGYLLWWNKRNLCLDFKATPAPAMASLVAGALMLAMPSWVTTPAGLTPETGLALTTWAFLLFLLSGAFLTLGAPFLRSAALPVALLVFAAPFPAALMGSSTPGSPPGCIEVALQNGSAEVAYWMLRLSGMPILRDGTAFQLPAFSMAVAPQCSGIRSTLVLFIVSLVAGYMQLNSRWSRAALVLAVIPLALLRNGLRIFTIGQLCVQIGPEMIKSYIHRQGGPIFFVISLIPFFLLLLLLRRIEGRKARPQEGPGNQYRTFPSK